MCGVNGIFAPGQGRAGNHPRLVERMNDLIRHRGPDDAGVWSDPRDNVCLGHRRLSIVDLTSRGHQPMVADDGTAIVYNGEIYNFRELRRELADYSFRSDTDTETLLALYRKKGARCVADLVGMFAFAIWDPAKNSLFLARDRIGKKPLYYTFHEGKFAFSSEIRSLLSLPWIKPELDEKAFYYFLTFGFVPPPLTMFSGIHKLEQAHSLRVNQNGISEPERYWSATYQEPPLEEQHLIDALRSELERSVDLRMMSDVPVGVFLSGGVDSTGIATMMKQRTDREIRSFSISFADQPDYDEAADARASATRLGLKHHERIVTRDDMQNMIPTIVDVLDEPLADPTCIPIYFLAQMAQEQNTKVVLTGDGPDELLLGYRNWRSYLRAYPWYKRYKALPKPVRDAGYAVARHVIPSDRIVELFHRASRAEELFWGSAPSFKESEKQGLLHPDFAARAKDWDCHDVISGLREEYDQAYREAGSGDANWMAYIGYRFVIPNFYLHRADRLGMCHSVELRTPFLDHQFVNMSLSIPAQWKLRNGEPKYILKKALSGIVPPEILYRRKQGFCVPLREWGGDVMVDTIMAGLDDICSRSGLLRRDAVVAQVDQFQKGNTGLTNNMWSMYFLIAWLGRWELV